MDVPCGAEKMGAGALVTGSALGSPSPWTVRQKPLQLSTGVFNPVTAPLCLQDLPVVPGAGTQGLSRPLARCPLPTGDKEVVGCCAVRRGSAPEHASMGGSGYRVCRGPRGEAGPGAVP